ncbi:MAG TPA: alpha/beta fold hydrolase [Solirubrobacteraceae bacterium]|nr:alpha/beta fold hydrolase [Solirubrobacteraceae bacterium]
MPRSQPVDGFSLAYDRHGEGPTVVLLHGWPGMRSDYRALVPLLGDFDVLVPDLRGFGESDKHLADPAEHYSAAAQARSVDGLLEELGLEGAILAGYDVGSRVAQALARDHPGRVRALVLAPPLPGIGQRILTPDAMREFWYQPFHRLDLAERLIDGDRDAVRSYLRHFWDHWGGPGFILPEAELDALVEHYAEPGAFVASINWYRAGSGGVAMSLAEQVPARQDRIAAPARVLWPEHDPLFPREWGDRLDEFFADVTTTDMPGTGHFSPLEAAEAFAAAIRELSAWTTA